MTIQMDCIMGPWKSSMFLSVILLLSMEKTVTCLTSHKLQMSSTTQRDSGTSANPIRTDTEYKRSVSMMAAAIPAAFAVTNPRIASAKPEVVKPPASDGSDLPLGVDGYTDLGGLTMCKLLNGMWQVSGGHGYEPLKEKAISEMAHCADEGFTTFDLADHYGPAEDYVGFFSKGRLSSTLAKECQFFTKWVPRPEEITRSMATAAIDKSLRRMGTDSLDLLQFHWWDYKNKYYYDAVNHLMHLKDMEKIKNIGLTNFDTEHLADLLGEGAPIVSNQVSFSVVDTRPNSKMGALCADKNVKLLCYGVLMGGFISNEWLNKPEPLNDKLKNISLRKYLPWIQYWGGWGLFQEMLSTLNVIANKHSVSISNVAVRWVLDQPAVGGAIVGVRFGYKEHINDNKRTFSFTLDKDDNAAIAAVQDKSRNLLTVYGDCGQEYRNR